VHLITCGHFRSRDKDGSHTIRSTIAENAMLYAYLNSVFYRIGVLPMEVIHWGNSDFWLFCSCDLDLDAMTFI